MAPVLAELNQAWPKFGRKFGRSRPHTIWQTLTKLFAKSGFKWPMFAKFGSASTELSPTSDQSRLTSANFGLVRLSAPGATCRELSATLGQVQSSPGSPEQTSGNAWKATSPQLPRNFILSDLLNLSGDAVITTIACQHLDARTSHAKHRRTHPPQRARQRQHGPTPRAPDAHAVTNRLEAKRAHQALRHVLQVSPRERAGVSSRGRP